MIMVMTFFIILLVSIAGCSSQSPSASPEAVTKLSTIEPSQMALQSAEIPANFTLFEKGERLSSELSDWALDHGWKKGYYSIFLKNDPGSPSVTVIEQYISVYPAQNISLIVPDDINNVKNWSTKENNISVDDLTIVTIGDSSSALRVSNKTDNTQEYIIAFVKNDVYQNFYTNGTQTDYETLKQLATIAAAKIT